MRLCTDLPTGQLGKQKIEHAGKMHIAARINIQGIGLGRFGMGDCGIGLTEKVV